ncbi:hypothetical protein SADO_14173 [Salinisphaera dokdonensis CL-ES53]|uniref:Uncharacterized protein n=1 Tax=Salinisphaera dokdonensis CL-ES53 TaxID=1304272 RepID=A0ABV2B3E4_9GAMM
MGALEFGTELANAGYVITGFFEQRVDTLVVGLGNGLSCQRPHGAAIRNVIGPSAPKGPPYLRLSATWRRVGVLSL